MEGKMQIGNLKVTQKFICLSASDPRRLQSPCFGYLPSFTGGLVGYFSYDYLRYSEPAVKCDVEDTEAFKDVDLMLFDKVITFDHLRQRSSSSSTCRWTM
jgi:anthranilate synthase component 1